MTNSKPRILCIDDDTHTCDWIRIMLRSANVKAEIKTAKSGRDAFYLLNRRHFDLCILEYALPDMTGVQLCGLVRKMGNQVPIMFFSAMNRPVDKQKAEAAGADEYLCKPDDLNIFVDAVTYLLNKHRQIYLRPFAVSTNAHAHGGLAAI